MHRGFSASSQSTMADCVSYICLCLPPERTWHMANDSKVDYSGDFGRGMSGMSRGSNPARLCWLTSHLVQCESDDPNLSPGTYA